LTEIRGDWKARTVLLFSALCSILMVFFSMLVTWNPHPALLIQGVQGRYFLVPFIVVSYALGGATLPFEGAARKVAWGLVLVLVAAGAYSVPRVLIERYFISG